MRLLNRTTLHYFIYSIMVLLIVTPAYYFVINKLFTDDVDESLLLQKKEIQARMQKLKSTQTVWEDLDGDVKLAPATEPILHDSLYSIFQYDSLSNELEPYRTLSAGIRIKGKPYHLLARISLVENEDLIEAIVKTQTVVLTLLLVGLLIINWRVSRRIWKPFYETVEKLKYYDVEKTPQLHLDESYIKEFQDLNKAIKQLADKNYKSYLSQKEFTENAAHELQSPLAVFQSKLELLMQTKNLSEEQALLIVSLNEATARLTKLNKALLLLSKIDNNQFIDIELVDVGALTHKLIGLFNKQASSKNITFTTALNNPLHINVNPALIDILLSNLISNAIKYSTAESSIDISLNGNRWEITNAGNPVALSSDKIYERFQKGNTSTTNTGLGLAIARKICDTTGIRIKYEFSTNLHLFSIDF